jgi:hypothetical protein
VLLLLDLTFALAIAFFLVVVKSVFVPPSMTVVSSTQGKMLRGLWLGDESLCFTAR